MTQRFGIVDLFAGPGGLSEGFSSLGDIATVDLSVEEDCHAISTLRLRSFLRQFHNDYPFEYYDALATHVDSKKTDLVLSAMKEAFPENWAKAEEEVLQLTLGKPGVFDLLSSMLDNIREAHAGNTILIGGPPCQAYSLVGRSRNSGIRDYVAEADNRHYLYRSYVEILERLRPAAFVMENVKGILSSQVDGGPIFQRILNDLHSTARSEGGYELFCISTSQELAGTRINARDFLVRAEHFGVPQRRHRVFIVGVRAKILRPSIGRSLTLPEQAEVSVGDIISALPALRSGLSKKGARKDWFGEVEDQLRAVIQANDSCPEVSRSFKKLLNEGFNTELPRRSDTYPEPSSDYGGELGAWIRDERLRGLPQHETRSHIRGDLGRYAYAATFARIHECSPKLSEFPNVLQPKHRNRKTGKFADRFRVQLSNRPSTTVTSHISKDGNYYIHPDPSQCRSLTVREAARLQTFPDNYFFCGPRTQQYKQVGNAVPPFLARQIALALTGLLSG